MKNRDAKNIDIDLLFFYLGISILSFILYVTRHPVISNLSDRADYKDLIIAYLPDLLIFLIVLIPYLIVLLILLVKKIAGKENISDNYYVILFFPLLSFFAKGMSLLQVYLYSNLIQIIKDNFAFFSFLFIGPLIVALNKFIIFINYKFKFFKQN